MKLRNDTERRIYAAAFALEFERELRQGYTPAVREQARRDKVNEGDVQAAAAVQHARDVVAMHRVGLKLARRWER